MVAIVKPTQGVKGALYYNEQKLEKGVASLILTNGFWKPAADLSFLEKKGYLEHLASQNKRAKFKGLHVTLNFDKSDKLSLEKMRAIAQDYMLRIGFGDQPYLVYEHRDANHPHLHIVTTTIQLNRRAIRLYGIGKFKSNPARLQIEKDYGLVVASGRRAFEQEMTPGVNITKARYAENGTRAEIARVVAAVRSSYKFTNLNELNAVLHQFGVQVNGGTAGTKLHQHHGLLYSMSDDKSRKVGVPIKASRLPGKPTLANLQSQFDAGRKAREFFRHRITGAVNGALAKKDCRNLSSFQAILKPYGIVPIFNYTKAGAIESILYLDNNKRCVFDARDLTGTPSVDTLAEKLSSRFADKNKNALATHSAHQPAPAAGATSTTSLHSSRSSDTTQALTDALLGSNARYESSDPYRKKKKRKRPGQDLSQ